MKKFITLYLILFSGLVHIQAQSNQSINLKFEVSNQEIDSLQIQGLDMISREIIRLDTNGLGTATLNLEQGVYYLVYGNNREKIYLSPGDLSISFDASQMTRSITFNGEGANESSYLIDKDTNDHNSIVLKPNLLDEDAFLKISDSIKQVNLNRLAAYQSKLNPDFVYWALGEVKYQYLFNIQRYQMLHRYQLGLKDFEVSERYPKVLETLNLSEGKLSSIFYYTNLVGTYIHQIATSERLENDTTDKLYSYLLKLDESVKNSEVKSQVAYWEAMRYLTRTSVPDLYFEQFRKLSTDSLQLQSIEKIYNNILLTQKGNPSPTFSFKNNKGKIVSLSDLKDKVVYIDVWATWCAPCIKEIPYLEKLQAEYAKKKIAFISIAWNDKEENWKSFIEEKEMGGIQLYSENSNAVFFKNYSLNGIPRFILLDKELNIVDANAKRPSDEALRKQLDELLEK